MLQLLIGRRRHVTHEGRNMLGSPFPEPAR